MPVTAPASRCISCQVEPALAGRATCANCQRARAIRARAIAAGLPPLDELEPSVEELAAIDADDLCDEAGYEIPPEVTSVPAGATAWVCECGRSFKTAAGLGGHRPCKVEQAAVVEPQPAMANSRLFDLVDLAVGWSCLTAGQQDTARAVCQLDPAELAVVVGIAGRFATRTNRIFDELRRGA